MSSAATKGRHIPELAIKTQLICIRANLWAASDKEEQDWSFTELAAHTDAFSSLLFDWD